MFSELEIKLMISLVSGIVGSGVVGYGIGYFRAFKLYQCWDVDTADFHKNDE